MMLTHAARRSSTSVLASDLASSMSGTLVNTSKACSMMSFQIFLIMPARRGLSAIHADRHPPTACEQAETLTPVAATLAASLPLMPERVTAKCEVENAKSQAEPGFSSSCLTRCLHAAQLTQRLALRQRRLDDRAVQRKP